MSSHQIITIHTQSTHEPTSYWILPTIIRYCHNRPRPSPITFESPQVHSWPNKHPTPSSPRHTWPTHRDFHWDTISRHRIVPSNWLGFPCRRWRSSFPPGSENEDANMLWWGIVIMEWLCFLSCYVNLQHPVPWSFCRDGSFDASIPRSGRRLRRSIGWRATGIIIVKTKRAVREQWAKKMRIRLRNYSTILTPDAALRSLESRVTLLSVPVFATATNNPFP